ncbi:MAG: hypothetical protein ACM3S1_00865 [Hyphomicrobiales bacterium]
MQTAAHSASGGLVIEQLNPALQPDPNGRHISTPKGDVIASDNDLGTRYSIIASGQAFTLTLPKGSTLGQKDALDLLLSLLP